MNAVVVPKLGDACAEQFALCTAARAIIVLFFFLCVCACVFRHRLVRHQKLSLQQHSVVIVARSGV